MSSEKDINLEIVPIKEPELADIPLNIEMEDERVSISHDDNGEEAAEATTAPRRKKKKKKRRQKENTTAEAPQNTETASEDGEESTYSRTRRLLLEISEMDEEDGRGLEVTLRSIIGGDVLAGWLRRNKWFILLLVIYTLIYVSNRYTIQQEMIESNHLSDTLLDRRYKALTQSSTLLERSLRSNIEENLQDTAIVTSVESPFVIKGDKYEEKNTEEQ